MKELIKNAPWKRLLWALWLPVYVITYFVVEALIPEGTSNLWYTQFEFEKSIPFCEYGIVFYVSWFVYIFGVGLNLWYFHDKPFKRYMLTLCVCFYLCVVIWILFPNACDLRSASDLERKNLFTAIVALIRKADTPTNVFPSEHVIGTFAALMGYIDCGRFARHRTEGILMCVWGFAIIASTVFVKQHALIDLPSGAAMALIAGFFIYRKRLKERSPYARS